VIRHSGADYALVLLEFLSSTVRLKVEDNGRGFDPAVLKNPARPSWGLLGIEERAHLLGGTMDVTSTPGSGTAIEVVVPYRREAEAANDHSTASG
jgi:signal transduction histidine kinase